MNESGEMKKLQLVLFRLILLCERAVTCLAQPTMSRSQQFLRISSAECLAPEGPLGTLASVVPAKKPAALASMALRSPFSPARLASMTTADAGNGKRSLTAGYGCTGIHTIPMIT